MMFLLIVFICYTVTALVRKTAIKNEWLPLIAGTLGALLNLIATYVIPTLVTDSNMVTALLYGFVCGLASTGGNQILKQAVKLIKDKYNIDIVLPTVTTQSNKKEK